MQKEKLTISNIKKDLFNEIKDGLWEPIALILLLLGASIITFKIPDIVYKFLFGCLAIIAFYLVVKQILVFVRLYRALHNTNCIVKDKLVGKEEKEHISRSAYYETRHLYFSSYGDYEIPDENYKWSSNFAMNASSLYNYYSNCDDEFYLVLSKPHTGKILYAYNTKMFELEKEKKI